MSRFQYLRSYFGEMSSERALREAEVLEARANHYPGPHNDPMRWRLRRESAAALEYAILLETTNVNPLQQ